MKIYPEIYDYEQPAKALIDEIKAAEAAMREAVRKGEDAKAKKFRDVIDGLERRLPRRTVSFKKGRAALIAWVRDRYIADYKRIRRNQRKSVGLYLKKEQYDAISDVARSMDNAKRRLNNAQTLILVMSNPYIKSFDALLKEVSAYCDAAINRALNLSIEGVTSLAEVDHNFLGFVRIEIINRLREWARGGDEADPGNTEKFLPWKKTG